MAQLIALTVGEETQYANPTTIARVSPATVGTGSQVAVANTGTIACTQTPAEVAALVAAAVTGGVQKVSVLVTNAQILALHTTAITLIPTPGSGKTLQILGVTFEPSGAGTVGAGGNMRVRVGTGDLFLISGANGLPANGAHTQLVSLQGVVANNTACTLGASAAITGATADLTVHVSYQIFD